jgi:homoserine acetyltransferase
MWFVVIILEVVVALPVQKVNPSSEKPYGKNFPQVSVSDWVNSQKMLDG